MPTLHRRLRNPVSHRRFRNATSKDREQRGSTDARCSCCGLCFGTSCLSVTVSAINICKALAEPCILFGDFAGGTFKLNLISSKPRTCVWNGCFSGIQGKCLSLPCDDGSPQFDSCNQVIVTVAWDPDNAIQGYSPELPFSVDVWGGTPNCSCALHYFSARLANITDGQPVTQVINPTCDVSGHSLFSSGTVTVHLPTDGACSGTAPIDCLDCDCAGEPSCDDTVPASLCDALPDAVTFDLSSLSLCDKTDCDASCTLGTVTLGKQAGCTCASCTYRLVILDGDGNPCVTITDTFDGTSWHLVITDVRCGDNTILWGGYLQAAATGPCGTYTNACGECCLGTSCLALTQLFGTDCAGGGCTSGCDGPCDDATLPTNNGDGVALSADLGGIVQCDGSALTGLGTATMTRFGGCSGGQFDGGNQGPANVPPADVDANIVWNDGAGYVLILSALPSSGTLWTGCCDTITGIYTRVCDGYFGVGVDVCCSSNCDVDFIVVSAA